MKSIQEIVFEKLKIKKSLTKYKPTTLDELDKIIIDILNNTDDKTHLDLNNIDTSEMTTFGEVLSSLKETVSIDISSWDSSKVTNMEYMFADCKKLETIYIGDWDVSKVTNMSSMFSRCFNLKEIVGIENWDVSNLENMNRIFYNCAKFNQDLSNWKLSNIKFFRTWNLDSGLSKNNMPKDIL